MMIYKMVFALTCCIFLSRGFGQQIISDTKNINNFSIVSSDKESVIYTDSADNWLVSKVSQLLQSDIQTVTGRQLSIVHSNDIGNSNNLIVIGTVGSSHFIKRLIQEKKIDVSKIVKKWDAFTIQTFQLNSGVKGVAIVGSNKRGAAYGAFTLSKQIGVSPWYWWADVPAKLKKNLFIKKNTFIVDSPRVKYRGIFINDEAPAFSGWCKQKFGGANHLVYEKIFELLLRLKANYLWPAMWGNAFNDDDTLNPILANKWGIVMGTSHHEPMQRAQQEWKRYGKGEWDYTKNEKELTSFWKKGIENMGHKEGVITIGMRGDGDMPMTQGTAIGLLEKIISGQRRIIEDVTHKPASQTPQVWALYKEVQDYYDKGMRVPEDVTLLLCDDNWGNIRRLPRLNEPARSGGYGIYYHFDYVGGPRNYKWINTNNIARVWEQMHLAYKYGVKKIWVVNVGDLKPMEFPISFWCDFAWNPEKVDVNDLEDYYRKWASDQFGVQFAQSVGSVLQKYSQYASRRKPELLNADTYSLQNYNEWKQVLGQWMNLLKDAKAIEKMLPSSYKDAYFQLVMHPILAMENLHQLYYDVAMNRYLSLKHDTIANDYARKAKDAFLNDSMISVAYNHLNHGKWNHMMDQTHIGYHSWQEPHHQVMPALSYVSGTSKGTDVNSTLFTNKQDGRSADSSAINLIPANTRRNVFYEKNGYVSIQATHYTYKIEGGDFMWKVIPGIGRDGDGIGVYPVTKKVSNVGMNNPNLDYEFYTYSKGDIKLNLYFSPTLNFHNSPDGLKFGISIDNGVIKDVSLNKEDTGREWGKWVADNIIIKSTLDKSSTPGKHTIKFWMISPAVVLQKIVLDMGGEKSSYLGPAETRKFNFNTEN